MIRLTRSLVAALGQGTQYVRVTELIRNGSALQPTLRIVATVNGWSRSQRSHAQTVSINSANSASIEIGAATIRGLTKFNRSLCGACIPVGTTPRPTWLPPLRTT